MSAKNDQSGFSRLEYLIWVNNKQGNIEVCSEMEKNKNLIGKRDCDGYTLLHVAVLSGNVDAMKCLIKCGSDVNVRDNQGKTPLFLAAESGFSERKEMMEILLKANANIHITENYGNSVINLVFHPNHRSDPYAEKFLLDVIYRECQNDSLLTAKKLISLRCSLWKTVSLGNAKLIEHMIANKCSVNSCQRNEKITALHRAVSMMDLRIVKVLVKNGANVDAKDYKGMLPIAYYGSYTPGEFQNPEIIKILLAKSILLKNCCRKNIIQFKSAFQCGTKKVIQMLLEYCSDMLNIKDKRGQTPLHYLAENYHSDITEELEGLEMNVNVRDIEGHTPLLIATQAKYSHFNTIQFLLQKGADINVCTFYYEHVALFSLCENSSKSEEEYRNIVEMFLQYDLDICFVGQCQITVFDIIMDKKKFYMAEPLLAHLAILEEQGNSVSEFIRRKIHSNEIFKNYFDVCKRELKEMNSTNSIDRRVTLYMILVTHKEKILKMCRYNTDLLSELENLKKECCSFNVYDKIIKKFICSIEAKIELYQSAKLIMCKLLKLENNVNHLAIAEIMKYLGDQDLQTLLKVFI